MHGLFSDMLILPMRDVLRMRKNEEEGKVSS